MAKESEANGKLVTKVESVFLNATDYSPEIKASKPGEPRLFCGGQTNSEAIERFRVIVEKSEAEA